MSYHELPTTVVTLMTFQQLKGVKEAQVLFQNNIMSSGGI